MGRKISRVAWVIIPLIGACTDATSVPVADEVETLPRTLNGNTLMVAGEKVRLWGIAAPSQDTEAGSQAAEALEALVADHAIACDPQYRSDEVLVAICWLPDGSDIGAELVRLGWAFDEPSLSTRAYDVLEDEAASNRRGLWAVQ